MTKSVLTLESGRSRTENGFPRKKGSAFPSRWKMLVDSFEFLDQALNEMREYKSHLGRNVYASVGHNSICVDIRQHWLPPNQTDVVPTKKGITLRPGEYAKLKDVAMVVGDFVPELSSVFPCPFSFGSHEPVRIFAMSRV